MAKTLAQQIKIFSDNINSHIDSSYNNLDRRINEAANIKVPKKTSELENDSSFLTKHQDLSSYAKKEDVYTKDNVDSIATRISNNKQDILVSGVNIKTINGNSLLGSGDLKIKSNNGSTSIVDSSIDLSDYYTKEEVDNKVETSISTTLDNKHYLTEHQKLKTINGQSLVGTGDIMITNSTQPDLSNYVTETALDQKGFITKDNADKIYQSKGNYALKTDIPDMSEYAKKSDIENYNPIDVSSFVTKNDVSSFVTNTELDNKHYLTEHQSLAEYAKKTDLPDTTPFLTKTSAAQTYQTIGDYALKSDVAKINLDNYYNKDQIDALSTLTNQRLASKQSTLVSGTNIKTINGNSLLGEGDLKITPDLSNYALKTDIPTDFYSKKYIDTSYNSLNSKIDSKQDIIDTSSFVTNTELDNKHYLTEHQALKTINGQSLVGTGDIIITTESEPDLSSYYTINQVDSLLSKKQDSGNYAKATDIYTKAAIDSSYNSLKKEIDSKQDSVDLSVYALKTEIPTDFYSKKYIDTSYNSLNSKIDSKQDKGDYALKTDIPDTSNFVTNTELNNKGYLTEHQDLTSYAKKSDLPTDFYNKAAIDSSYYALQNEINSKQAKGDYALKTDIPDTSNFATKDDLESKQDKINTITSNVNGLKIWVGTTVEYNAFDSYDSSTLYFIKS